MSGSCSSGEEAGSAGRVATRRRRLQGSRHFGPCGRDVWAGPLSRSFGSCSLLTRNTRQKWPLQRNKLPLPPPVSAVLLSTLSCGSWGKPSLRGVEVLPRDGCPAGWGELPPASLLKTGRKGDRKACQDAATMW